MMWIKKTFFRNGFKTGHLGSDKGTGRDKERSYVLKWYSNIVLG